jgi:hypothetical protein
VRRSGRGIINTRTRRTLYLSVVRAVLAYASRVWSSQSIGLIKRTERIQRRASKFILNLPYTCSESYRERLITLELMPLSYWHEYMDLDFFYKAINGLVVISEGVLPKPLIPTRVTRSSSVSELSFRPPKCRSRTFQRSYITRVTRVWNCLPTDLRHPSLSLLRQYYSKALHSCFDAENPRTWRSIMTICLNCNSCRSLTNVINCCF